MPFADFTFAHLTRATSEEEDCIRIGTHRYAARAERGMHYCLNYCLSFLGEREKYPFCHDGRIDANGECPNDGLAPSAAPAIVAMVRARSVYNADIPGTEIGLPRGVANLLLRNTRLYRALEQAWFLLRPTLPLPGQRGGHVYPGIFEGEFLYTSECANLCGCSMGHSRCFAPVKKRDSEAAATIGPEDDFRGYGWNPSHEGLNPHRECPYAQIPFSENPVIVALADSEERAASLLELEDITIQTLLNRWDVTWAIRQRKAASASGG